MIFFRTGWTEDDTYVSLKYGDNFWSHEHFDDGHFTIFNRGNLAIESGTYQAGSTSEHRLQYAQQTVAHNTILLVDPADVYNSGTTAETLSVDVPGNVVKESIANDGGQRRLGSLYNATHNYQGAVTPTATQLNMSFQNGVPSSINRWAAMQEQYSTGKLLAFASGPAYSYAAVDITRAYSNAYSPTTPNTINRTNRATSVIRHMVFIPKGHNAFVIVFDKVTTSNANITKKWLLHTINEPVIGPSVNGVTSFNVTRAECVTPLPYGGNYWTIDYASQLTYRNCAGRDANYQYAGNLSGWSVYPSSGSVVSHGGSGHEFDVEDPTNPGTYTNWNRCINTTQCGSANGTDFGLGLDTGTVAPNPMNGVIEPGSWRIEEKPTSAANTDYFLNMFYAAATANLDRPSSVVATTSASNRGVTWSDNLHTYTVDFNTTGIGGNIIISGTVNESLLTNGVQVPASVAVTAGNNQSASSGTNLSTLASVLVKDANGNPIPNVGVRFAVTTNNGSTLPAFTLTDGSGVASTMVKVTGNTGDTVAISAVVNGLPTAGFTESVAGGASPALSSLLCSPTSLVSQGSSTCTLTLSQASGAGGVTVTLSSGAANLTLPASVLVTAGLTTATFSVTAGTITTSQSAAVTATLNGVSQSAALSLVGLAPTLTLIACTPTTVSSGGTVTCTVTLSAPAGSSGVNVTLSSTTAVVSVPAFVSVPAGSTSISFTATVGTVSTSQIAMLTATYNGASQTSSIALAGTSTGGIPLTTGDWVAVPAHGPPVNAVGWETLSYVPSLGAHCWLGTFHDMGSEPNFSLNCYNPQTNRFDVNQLGGQMHQEDFPEAGHPSGTFGYSSKSGVIFTIGMDSGSNQAEHPFFTWALDPVGRTARNLQPAVKAEFPSMIGQGAGTFDDYHNFLLMHGGDSFMGTWLYNPDNNRWLNVNSGVDTCESSPGVTAPCPTGFASYHLSSAAYDSYNQRVYLFSGNYGGVYQNTLAWYDASNSAWVIVNPSGGVSPPSRDRGALAYDSVNHVLMAYGGEGNAGYLTDTWIYDIATNTWKMVTTPHSPGLTAGVFSRLSYDPLVNAFVLVNTQDATSGYLDGIWNTSYSVLVWMFRYSGVGSNVGTVISSYTVPVGSLNRNGPTAWAKEPVLIPNGSGVTLAFTELSAAFSGNGTISTSHVMVDQFGAGRWTLLGSGTAVNTDEGGDKSWADRPVMALSNGALWEAHNQFSYGGVVTSGVSQIYAKSWNGVTWAGGQIGITNLASNIGLSDSTLTVVAGTGGDLPPSNFVIRIDNEGMLITGRTGDVLTIGTRAYGGYGTILQTHSAGAGISVLEDAQGQQSITSCGGSLVISFAENSHLSLPIGLLHVKMWNGSSWTLLGTSALNIAAAATRIEDTSIACDGTNPVVVWSEWASSNGELADAPPQIYVKRWNGSAWTSLGGSLNTNPGNWAYSPSISWMGSQPYVAWVERTSVGTTQVYVQTWNGSSWSSVGPGSLNRSTTGWAWKPQITNDGTSLYVGWVEQAAYGQSPQVYVNKYANGAWSGLGSSLNVNSAGGAAERVTLAVSGGQPMAAWGEVTQGFMRQIFVKQWNGSTWGAVNGIAFSACDLNMDGVVDSGDVQLGDQPGDWNNTMRFSRFDANRAMQRR